MTKDKIKASIFLGILNDLKRNDEVAAKELGVSIEQMRSWLSGDVAIPEEMLNKAAQIWPVNRRDFEPLVDDMPEGVVIMRSDESQKSERVLSRKGVPYYAYRDTAMSRIAPFKPEWIQELVDVESSDPEDKKVSWNNGHFLHQFTYFIGPVNFYYIRNNKRCLAEMNTGDSMYITPFVPHTFTTRKNNEGKRGLILALTFAGNLGGDCRPEMGALGASTVSQMILPDVFSHSGVANLLRQQMTDACISIEELSKRTSLTPNWISAALDGKQEFKLEQLQTLANALQIRVKDLLGHDISESEEVRIQKCNEGRTWNHASCRFQQLAHTELMPQIKSFEVSIAKGKPTETMVSSLFQYAYILGKGSVTLSWEQDGKTFQKELKADDSFVMKPMVKHSFEAQDETKILLLRAPGRLYGDALLELSSLPDYGIRRAVQENKQWYR